MLVNWLQMVRRWVSRQTRSTRRERSRRAKGSRVSSYRIWFEPLEDRMAPAAISWKTPGAGGDWNTAANWSPNVVPTSADDVAFGAGTYSVTTDAGAANAKSITFSGGANLTISGANALTIAAGGITETGTTTTDTISANVTLGAAQTWNVGSGNSLTVSGVVSGSANLTIGNATSTGILYLQGVNSYSGNITIIGGALDLNSTGTMASAANITVYGGGNLTLDNSSTANSTRLGNSTNINMAGGNLTLIGSASAATTQNYGQLSLSSGESIITVTADGAAIDLNGLTGNSTQVINRSAGATVLFRGTNLGGAANITMPTGNAAFITFNTPIANTTTNGGLIGGTLNTTSAAILPYALGGANTTDTGSNFVTYEVGNATTGHGLGIRLLNSNGATETGTGAAGCNLRIAEPGGSLANGTFNSVFFTGSTAAGWSQTWVVTSGAVAATGNSAYQGNAQGLEFDTLGKVLSLRWNQQYLYAHSEDRYQQRRHHLFRWRDGGSGY